MDLILPSHVAPFAGESITDTILGAFANVTASGRGRNQRALGVGNRIDSASLNDGDLGGVVLGGGNSSEREAQDGQERVDVHIAQGMGSDDGIETRS